jgi:sugar O-acyltransferase (sialic acid O-acetyltransferase NeuD family)
MATNGRGQRVADSAQAPLVIVGDGEFAEIAYEYFTHDSDHAVAAFVVEDAFHQRDELFGLPVIRMSELESRYPAGGFAAFVAITNTQLNRVRARLFREMKGRGYALASYVSSRAFVWHNVSIGENSFIFEDNVLQYHVQVGDNCVLWSGNHVGHRSNIGDHCFITSHAVISGYCNIGPSCFIGVNSSFADRITVAPDCIIGMGSVVVRDTEPGRVYVGNPAKPLEKSAYETFKVPAEAV